MKAISDKDFEKAVFLREREIEVKEEIERLKQERDNSGDETMEVTKKDIEEIDSLVDRHPGHLDRSG